MNVLSLIDLQFYADRSHFSLAEINNLWKGSEKTD